MRALFLVVLAGVALAGCAQQRPPSLAEQIAATPLPTTDEGREAECGKIRMMIADQRSRGQVAGVALTNPMMQVAAQRVFMQNIAALENRASMDRCRAAFGA